MRFIGEHTLKERFIHWKDTESIKLGGMTLGKKISYILTYYKSWFLILLIFLLFASYFGEVIINANKEIVLEGFFTNDEWDLFNSSHMLDEYGRTLDLDDNQLLILDDDLYISMNGDASELTAASQSRIIAYMSTGELDFVVCPGNVLDYFMNGNAVPMKPFDSFLPEELFPILAPHLRVGPDAERQDALIALDLTMCRYVAGAGADQNDNITDTYYMFIPYNASRLEQLSDFLRFLFVY